MRIVYGMDEIVAQWVALHIPQMAHNPDFGVCVAAGIVDSNEIPIGGVVWHNYHPQYRSIEVSCAAETSRWLTRPIISEIFRYPFAQLGVNRIQAVTPAEPTSARLFLKKFGFAFEGLVRDGFGPGRNAKVWSLLKSEWDQNPFNVERVATSGLAKERSPLRRTRRKAARPPLQSSHQRAPEAGVSVPR